eukprot:c38728_g1_i1 orf=218-682(+)
MLGFAAENLILTAVAGSSEILSPAAEPLSASKAMWRAIAHNPKRCCFPLGLHRCRSTCSLALSATVSPSPSLSACDSAAVARLSQGAPSWFCVHLFSNNGEEQKSVSSYQESVSTIDSVLCSLPVLTSHMKQSSSTGFLSISSSSSCHNPTGFP